MMKIKIIWRGVEVELNWKPEWFGFEWIDHLEFRSDRVLPVSESGYNSHFIIYGSDKTKRVLSEEMKKVKNTQDEKVVAELGISILERACLSPGRKRYWKGRRGREIPMVDGSPPHLPEVAPWADCEDLKEKSGLKCECGSDRVFYRTGYTGKGEGRFGEDVDVGEYECDNCGEIWVE